jgi:nicotinate-nucleotide--dimethylbenzimidazole phosphoribosyltransferase
MLEKILEDITPLKEEAMAAAREHHGRLAIPAGSLGRLHDIAIQLAGITGAPRPAIKAPAIITMAADHGVAARRVSLFPQEVTREMVANFMRGGAAVNVLTQQFGIRLTVVDIGVAGPLQDVAFSPNPMMTFINTRIADGTADMTRGPAMDRKQARAAVETGISVFERTYDEGVDAVGTGDMGIANTTASAAVASVLLGRDPAMVANRGTGIDDAVLAHKIRMIEQSIKVNRPDAADPLDVLAKVGGFEIGGITGVILGACARRVPVVVDGFISTAGALLAAAFHPGVKDFLFAGHRSAVDGHGYMLDSLGLTPLVDLGMRLGEGTGATFGLSIIAAAAAAASRILTFEEATVSGPAQQL